MTSHHKPSFLVVDDLFVAAFLRTVLRKRGYDAVECDLSRGVELMRENPSRFDVLITNSPAAFVASASEVPLLYLAACPDPELTEPFKTARVLRKPFKPVDLFAAVDDLLASAVTTA